jgi:hypothetical protein
VILNFPDVFIGKLLDYSQIHRHAYVGSYIVRFYYLVLLQVSMLSCRKESDLSYTEPKTTVQCSCGSDVGFCQEPARGTEARGSMAQKLQALFSSEQASFTTSKGGVGHSNSRVMDLIDSFAGRIFGFTAAVRNRALRSASWSRASCS